MYSKFGLKLVHFAIIPSYFLGSNSIYFNPETKTFYTTKLSRWRLLIATVIMVFIGLFISWRTLEIFLCGGANSNEYFHISYAFSYISVVCCGAFVFVNLYQSDLCQVGCRLVRYCR